MSFILSYKFSQFL